MCGGHVSWCRRLSSLLPIEVVVWSWALVLYCVELISYCICWAFAHLLSINVIHFQNGYYRHRSILRYVGSIFARRAILYCRLTPFYFNVYSRLQSSLCSNTSTGRWKRSKILSIPWQWLMHRSCITLN